MTEENNKIEKTKREPLEKLSYAEKGRFFKLRNVLNIVFIILALAGFYIYYKGDQTTSWSVLIAAVVVKGVECVLRILH